MEKWITQLRKTAKEIKQAVDSSDRTAWDVIELTYKLGIEIKSLEAQGICKDHSITGIALKIGYKTPNKLYNALKLVNRFPTIEQLKRYRYEYEQRTKLKLTLSYLCAYILPKKPRKAREYSVSKKAKLNIIQEIAENMIIVNSPIQEQCKNEAEKIIELFAEYMNSQKCSFCGEGDIIPPNPFAMPKVEFLNPPYSLIPMCRKHYLVWEIGGGVKALEEEYHTTIEREMVKILTGFLNSLKIFL